MTSLVVPRVQSEVTGTENTGTGNDYMSWEFYKDTRVLYGSVIVNERPMRRPSHASCMAPPMGHL